jgi:hypothetical protein
VLLCGRDMEKSGMAVCRNGAGSITAGDSQRVPLVLKNCPCDGAGHHFAAGRQHGQQSEQ